MDKNFRRNNHQPKKIKIDNTMSTQEIKVAVTVIDLPSRSKGWGRYSVRGATGAKLMASSSGNEWISASHKAELAAGVEIVVTVQCMLRTKSGKSTTTAQDYRLVVEAGATAEIDYKPGSQGVVLRVENARCL